LKKKKQKNFNKKIERSSIFYESFEGFGKLFQKFPKKNLFEKKEFL